MSGFAVERPNQVGPGESSILLTGGGLIGVRIEMFRDGFGWLRANASLAAQQNERPRPPEYVRRASGVEVPFDRGDQARPEGRVTRAPDESRDRLRKFAFSKQELSKLARTTFANVLVAEVRASRQSCNPPTPVPNGAPCSTPEPPVARKTETDRAVLVALSMVPRVADGVDHVFDLSVMLPTTSLTWTTASTSCAPARSASSAPSRNKRSSPPSLPREDAPPDLSPVSTHRCRGCAGWIAG